VDFNTSIGDKQEPLTMDKEKIIKELVYKAIRSGGPGGQHVNKVSSKVQLTFDVRNSEGLSTEEKERLCEKLNNQLSKLGVLLLSADDKRSQLQNRTIVTKRFFNLIKDALKIKKKRKASKPSKAAIEKRLKEKKIASQKKSNRVKPDYD